MRITLLLAALLLLAPAARAQVEVSIRIPVPTIRFEVKPAVVVVAPGVHVVPDHDDEVFFVDRAYWCRRDGRWFKAHDHRGHWVVVEEKRVPKGLRKLEPGKYKRYKAKKHGKGKGKGRHRD